MNQIKPLPLLLALFTATIIYILQQFFASPIIYLFPLGLFTFYLIMDGRAAEFKSSYFTNEAALFIVFTVNISMQMALDERFPVFELPVSYFVVSLVAIILSSLLLAFITSSISKLISRKTNHA